jgi:hypothetical protein
MQLKVHRAILLLALRRANERKHNSKLMDSFQQLWLGNWLTDMNQATAFFDAFEERRDPYKIRNSYGTYDLPKVVKDNHGRWLKLYQALWQEEWKATSALQKFSGFPDQGATPLDIQEIGGYYPLDHFDVVDPLDDDGNPISREFEEFEDPNNTGLTLTAREGVFTYVREALLNPAFSVTGNARFTDLTSLRWLGHGLHTLQDFYAHSNFTETLLHLAGDKIPALHDLDHILDRERKGSFAAYAGGVRPEDTMIMTGRFDRIDTAATILNMYRHSLVPDWQDLAAADLIKADLEPASAMMLDVMLGTFSDIRSVRSLLKVTKKLTEVKEFLSDLGSKISRGAIKVFASVGKLFAKDSVDTCIDEMRDLLLAGSGIEQRNYVRAGKILYLERVIEKRLRHKLVKEPFPQLPHHTLLAKDHDASHPECRLAFKLACSMATDLSTEILHLYFTGATMADVDQVLHKHFQHPRELIVEDQFRSRITETIGALYGVRWWLWADEDMTKIIV